MWNNIRMLNAHMFVANKQYIAFTKIIKRQERLFIIDKNNLRKEKEILFPPETFKIFNDTLIINVGFYKSVFYNINTKIVEKEDDFGLGSSIDICNGKLLVFKKNELNNLKSFTGIYDLKQDKLLWIDNIGGCTSVIFTENYLCTADNSISTLRNHLVQDGTLLFEVNLDEIVTTDPSVDEYIKILGVYEQSLLIAYRGKVFMLDAQTGKLQKEWERIPLQRELYQKGIYHYFYQAVHFVLDATQGKIIGLNEDNYVEIDLKTDKVTVLNRSQYYQQMSITEAHRAICLTPTHIITTAEANPRHSPKHQAVISDYWVIALNRESKEIDWRHEFTFDEGIWLAGTNPPQIIDNQLFIKSNNDKLIIFDKIEMNQ